jgi:hypothetical protein
VEKVSDEPETASGAKAQVHFNGATARVELVPFPFVMKFRVPQPLVE